MTTAGVNFLSLGFRPFFLGAVFSATTSMVLWALMYQGAYVPVLDDLSGAAWHAHEMIYGYALAVVAGFLLTAVGNWTGLETLSGWRLAALALMWLTARVALLFGTRYLLVAALFDLLFIAGLFVALARPLWRARLRRQLGVLAKVFFMGAGNVLFYLGCFAVVERGVEWSLYGGLYLLIGLILTIGARVLPGFIERGLKTRDAIRNPTGLTIASMLLFVPFFVVELFAPNAVLAACLATGIAFVNACRMVLWHRRALWRKPLLWGLYLAFAFIVVGFALFALSAFTDLSKLFALHALGAGGIGLATLSMMARVTLGHTGRDVAVPPRGLGPILAILLLAVFVRVVLPLGFIDAYASWMLIAQTLWVTAFGLFAWGYVPMLLAPRVDAASA